MKNSKILRGISYCLLPILVAILCISIFYTAMSTNNEFMSEEEFFKSENFAYMYLGRLREEMHALIYANKGWQTIQDGTYTIYQYGSSYFDGMENFDSFLIIYGNKAMTNVRFSEETNTVEKIKAYLLEKNQNYISYENQVYNSNTEAFSTAMLEDYFYRTSIKYYTKDDEISENKAVQEFQTMYQGIPEENGVVSVDLEASDEENANVEEVEQVSLEANDMSTDVSITPAEEYDYHIAKIEDFTFYSSYTPKLQDGSETKAMINIVSMIQPYESTFPVVMIVSTVALLIIVIYLINSIGHEKGKDEIVLNDFDRVPLEGILIVFFAIFAITAIILSEIPILRLSTQIIISIILTMYCANFIVLEMLVATTIARLKAKKFLETCLCGKLVKWAWNLAIRIIKWFLNLLKRIKNKLKNIFNECNQNMNLVNKLILTIGIYLIVSGLLIMILGPIGAIIDLAVAIYAVYEIIMRIVSFKKLEEGLKKIYDGEKVTLYQADFSNEFAKCVEYVNDISNGFENAVEESLKSERLKTELITNVSHDIKTPLTSIINYVDLIKKEEIDNEKIKEYVEILDNKSQRLKKLTEDLVEASKASSGNVSLNLEEIGITELLNQAMGEYKDKFEAKKLEVISNFPKENVKIKADSRYIYRVIENLFGNIAKYTLESSRVYIETEIKDKNVKIVLKNISKERLNITEEELMQRFVRGDKSRTTEGSGLGLAIARSLTELQGGVLNCKIDGDLFKVELEFKTI